MPPLSIIPPELRENRRFIYIQTKSSLNTLHIHKSFRLCRPASGYQPREGGNWKIKSLSDQSLKLVPEPTFPQLKSMAGRFYATET